MRHEKIPPELDVAPATFVRSLVICLALGAAFWAAVAMVWL